MEKFTTTFYSDFKIADRFGTNAIKDTYKRAKKEWKTDVRYMTDLTIVMNTLCWEHWEKDKDKAVSNLYADLYYDCRNYCLDHFKGKDFDYFYELTE